MTHVREEEVGWARKLLACTNDTFEKISVETSLSAAQLYLLERGVLDACDHSEAALILAEIPETATYEEAMEIALSLMYWY